MQKTRAHKLPFWLVLFAATFVPGAGHVILGKPRRGLLFIFWIFVFGFITFHLTTAKVSIVGRWSGGIAVWTLSLLEVQKLAAPAKQ